MICVVSSLPSLLCWEHVPPGSADQDQGMPRSPETAIAQSCECSTRCSLEEAGPGTKQTEPEAASRHFSEQEAPFSVPPGRPESALQLRPAPGGALVAQAPGAVHNDSDPQHLPPTPSPPPRAGSVRARGRQSPALAGSLHHQPRYMGASGRRAMFCREGRSPRPA